MPVSGGSSYQQEIANALYGGQAQTIGQAGLQGAQAINQAGQAPSALGAGAENLESSYGYALANAGLSQQDISLQEALTGQQSATAAAQQGFEQQTYGLQQQQLALDPQSIALQNALLGTQENVAAGTQQLAQGAGGVGGGGFAAQLANLAYELPQQFQQQAGAAGAAGATNTVGNKQAQQNIGEQFSYNVGNVEDQAKQSALAYQGQMAGYQEQAGQNKLSLQNDYLQSQINAINQQSEQAGYQGQQEQYQNALAQLGVSSAQTGVSAQQAYEQMAYGINQLGVSTDMTPQIIQAMTGESGEATGLAQLGQAGAVVGGLGTGFGNY